MLLTPPTPKTKPTLPSKHKATTMCVLSILVLALCLPSLAQMTTVGIDCSRIRAFKIYKQDNFRAGRAMIECGLAPAGTPSTDDELLATGEEWLAPLGVTNVLVSNRTCASSSSCTKSESMVWTSGSTIVDNYNDHNPTYNSYSGTSYSTNGGTTFTEIQPPPFATGHGSNFGDPIVVFNARLNKWFAGDLVSGGNCGAQGIGMWTSTNGQTWAVGSCAHVGSMDDRESMWVDNEPTSGTYGRMYISFNDFANNSGALVLVRSDNGTTWTGPVVIKSSFIRNVQLTGSPVGATRYEGSNSTVFVAAMDEGTGGLATRQNVIYKSLDGGVTWTSTTTGARFTPPGSVSCGYFEAVAPIWRHMGWGQPGVGQNGVVHYAYAGAGTNGDVGDIYYVRSTDNGRTWSVPIKLNSDIDNAFHTQWMPSLSADRAGNVTVAWYDRRAASTTCSVATDVGCSYERVGRQSSDNGVSFGADITISSALIPQPTQTDPGVQACYAGDYDYDSNINGKFSDTWTDGRRNVSGVQEQDVEFGLAVSIPGASVSPAILNFGTRFQNDPPVTKTMTLTNNASTTMTITSIGQQLNDPFTVSGTTCGATLGAGLSCTITVKFSPLAAGVGLNTDTLSIVDSAINSPQNVAVSGTMDCPPTGCRGK